MVSCWPIFITAFFHLCTTLYYGSPLPNSMIAKSVSSTQFPKENLFWYKLVTEYYQMYGSFYLFGILSVVGLLVSMKFKALRPVVVFYVVYAIFFSTRAPNFLWYRSPLIIISIVAGCVLIGNAADLIFEKFAKAKFTNRSTIYLAKGGLGFVLLCISIFPQIRIYELITIKAMQRYGINIDQKAYASVGKYLNETAGEDAVLATHEIGYLGYFFDGKIYDMEGLVTPAAVEAKRQGVDPLEYTEAQWFVHPFAAFDRTYYPGFKKNMEEHGFEFETRFPWDFGVTNVYYRENNDKSNYKNQIDD